MIYFFARCVALVNLCLQARHDRERRWGLRAVREAKPLGMRNHTEFPCD
jgi:hypothetical protein